MTEYEQPKAVATTFPLATYRVRDIFWTAGLLLAAVILPAIFAHTPNNQWITGTIVNAILFIAVWRVGIANAALIAALPSSVALMRGLLPAPMAVLIPYIIVSNLLLISIFYFLPKYPLFAVVLSSLAKFLFLFAVTSYFVKIATPFIVMMQWSQLFTALAWRVDRSGIYKINSL